MHLLRVSVAILGVITVGQSVRAEIPRADFKKMQGEWSLVRAERNGVVAEGAPDVSGLVVRGSRYAIGSQPDGRRRWQTEAGQITLNGNRWPKQIDLTITSGPQAGATYRGIYEFDGGAQRVTFAPPGRSRPTGFSPVRGSGETAYFWQRPMPQMPAAIAPIGQTPQFNYSPYPQSPAGYYGGGPYWFPVSPGL